MTSFAPFILEPSWQNVFRDQLQEPYLVELAAFVEKEYALSPTPIFPPKELIFNAFFQTPFDQVNVLIIGQDPYHGIGQAHGLSFSVPKGVKPPPSLQNIFKELEADLQISRPAHGCLTKWTKQGVMLLNATLTVRQSQPLSHHGKGWERFTDEVVRKLAAREDPVIFVLWGKSAQDKCRFINEIKTPSPHLILTAAHPSPFSAHNGFFGCRHFSKINERLAQEGKTAIDWQLE
jgi:uracil-DNA glycosylase